MDDKKTSLPFSLGDHLFLLTDPVGQLVETDGIASYCFFVFSSSQYTRAIWNEAGINYIGSRPLNHDYHTIFQKLNFCLDHCQSTECGSNQQNDRLSL